MTVTVLTVGINPFVRRQTPESPFSHYEGSLEAVARQAAAVLNWGSPPDAKPGYRVGVLRIVVPPEGYWSAVVNLAEQTDVAIGRLDARLTRRQPEELPYVDVTLRGGFKSPAKAVELIVYRRDVLLEEGPDKAPTGCDWELVSINARATIEPEPMHPIAMARNFLGHTGGTKAEYTAEDFARSIAYWQARVMTSPVR
jgi:hypothetical protein